MFRHLDCEKKFTQVGMSGLNSSIKDPNQSSLLRSSSSFQWVKGKALGPHILIMGAALWCSTVPCGFSTTMIGSFLKCHCSLTYLIPDIEEKFCTTNHDIWDRSNSNFFCMSLVQYWSTIGIQTTSYLSLYLLGMFS